MIKPMILQWNIRSLPKNKPFISKLCSELLPSILCLQETHAKISTNIKIPGFNVVSRREREGGGLGGGVAILATPSTPIVPCPLFTDLEAVAAIYLLNSLKITIISLYLPPSPPIPDLSHKLNSLIEDVVGPLVICLDGNGHSPNWGSSNSNPRGSCLSEWIRDNDLHTLNNLNPTYETHTGNFTHIDLTLTKNLDPLTLDWNTHFDNLHSDHFPILISSISNPSPPVPPNKPKLNLKLADWSKFNDLLDLPQAPFSSPADVGRDLISSFLAAAYLSIPVSKPNANPCFTKSWWNTSCDNAKKSKNKAFRAYKRNLGNVGLWTNYKRLKAKYVHTILSAKKLDLDTFITSINRNTPSRLIYNKLKNLRCKRSHAAIILKRGDSFISDPAVVANLLASDFSSRGSVPPSPPFPAYTSPLPPAGDGYVREGLPSEGGQPPDGNPTSSLSSPPPSRIYQSPALGRGWICAGGIPIGE